MKKESVSWVTWGSGIFCIISGINMLYQYRYVYDATSFSIWNLGFPMPSISFFGVTAFGFSLVTIFVGVACFYISLGVSPESGRSLLRIGSLVFMMFAVNFLFNGIILLFGTFLLLAFLLTLGRRFLNTPVTSHMTHGDEVKRVRRDKDNKEYLGEFDKKRFLGMRPTSPFRNGILRKKQKRLERLKKKQRKT